MQTVITQHNIDSAKAVPEKNSNNYQYDTKPKSVFVRLTTLIALKM
jgi:hypothetical protein